VLLSNKLSSDVCLSFSRSFGFVWRLGLRLSCACVSAVRARLSSLRTVLRRAAVHCTLLSISIPNVHCPRKSHRTSRTLTYFGDLAHTTRYSTGRATGVQTSETRRVHRRRARNVCVHRLTHRHTHTHTHTHTRTARQEVAKTPPAHRRPTTVVRPPPAAHVASLPVPTQACLASCRVSAAHSTLPIGRSWGRPHHPRPSDDVDPPPRLV
jgi:hypothetical protein